jgi:hypothetical protein
MSTYKREVCCVYLVWSDDHDSSVKYEWWHDLRQRLGGNSVPVKRYVAKTLSGCVHMFFAIDADDVRLVYKQIHGNQLIKWAMQVEVSDYAPEHHSALIGLGLKQ